MSAHEVTDRTEPLYEEVQIDSWDKLLKSLDSLSVNWVFRGHSDAKWGLQSTLARRFKVSGIDCDAWVVQEERILKIFRRKAHLFLDHIPDDEDSFRWLGMMQHHGAPTRLLDFTYSFYVAAFFALESATGDAAIWAVNLTALKEQMPKAGDTEIHLRAPGTYENYFLNNDLSFVAFGDPFFMNQRLIAQSGLFLIPSTLKVPVEEILQSSNPKALVKYVLHTSKLRTIAMRKLYDMNISYYTLFPGLDGLARSMGYESEIHWAYDPQTMRSTLND